MTVLFDVRAKRELHRGYSDSLGRGMELTLSLVFVGGFGWLLDRWLGTDPFLAVLFGAIGVAGVGTKLWIGYDRDMRAHDEGKPWARRPESGGAS